MPDASGLVTATILNIKISEFENKIPSTSCLVTTTAFNARISEVENTIPNNSKYFSAQEFNKLTAQHFEVRLKQVDLASKADFYNEITRFKKQTTSNKTRHLDIQKKLNSVITKYYTFFFGRIYFTSNDGSQNTFVYQLTFHLLELKKDKGIDDVLSKKSKGVYNF